MNFGPGEMAQMMDSAKALITVTIVSGIGIGIVLGAIVAVYRIFSAPRCRPIVPIRNAHRSCPADPSCYGDRSCPGGLMQLRRLASDYRSGAQTT